MENLSKNRNLLSGIVLACASFQLLNPSFIIDSVADEAAEAAVVDGGKMPADYLKFWSELDGKCQILSDGGKLRMMENTHPNKSIKFLLSRLFAGVRQPGYAKGILNPEDEPKQLGCTRVQNRDQTWLVVRAEFVE